MMGHGSRLLRRNTEQHDLQQAHPTVLTHDTETDVQAFGEEGGVRRAAAEIGCPRVSSSTTIH
jgi:hypothetical protein